MDRNHHVHQTYVDRNHYIFIAPFTFRVRTSCPSIRCILQRGQRSQRCCFTRVSLRPFLHNRLSIPWGHRIVGHPIAVAGIRPPLMMCRCFQALYVSRLAKDPLLKIFCHPRALTTQRQRTPVLTELLLGSFNLLVLVMVACRRHEIKEISLPYRRQQQQQWWQRLRSLLCQVLGRHRHRHPYHEDVSS